MPASPARLCQPASPSCVRDLAPLPRSCALPPLWGPAGEHAGVKAPGKVIMDAQLRQWGVVVPARHPADHFVGLLQQSDEAGE